MVAAIGLQNRELHEPLRNPVSNHGCCAVILRVVAAVANIFRTVGLWLVEAASNLRDFVFVTEAAVIGAIPTEQRDDVTVLAVRAIIQEMGYLDRISIIEAITAVPGEERAQLVRNAALLITPEMGCFERTWAIQNIARIPVNERDAVIAFGLQAIIQGMNIFDKQNIIAAVAAVLVEERDNVMQHALQLINDRMHGYEIGVIIRAVAGVAAHQRANYVQWRREGFPADVFQGQLFFIQHALQLIAPQMGVFNGGMIIENVAGVAAHQRANDVQQRRQGLQAHVFQNAQVAAAQGINVHEGDRDERVRAAIELLRQHQGALPIGRSPKAVQEFTQYLNARAMNAEHKRLAQHAFMTPKSPNETFGPLMDEEGFSLLGLMTSGEEVISRLWVFASGLAEPDQTNAKDSMISALKDSYLMGTRVCNVGKTQGLVVGVLQGRLAGVDIELMAEMQVPTHQAVEMFFNIEAHRGIERVRLLVSAANRFCKENPAVNRADFIREIREYAQAQGFQP